MYIKRQNGRLRMGGNKVLFKTKIYINFKTEIRLILNTKPLIINKTLLNHRE